MEVIELRKPIRLGQFLKYANLVMDGAGAREAIQAGLVQVNGEVCCQRGRQLAHGDQITCDRQMGAAPLRVEYVN